MQSLYVLLFELQWAFGFVWELYIQLLPFHRVMLHLQLSQPFVIHTSGQQSSLLVLLCEQFVTYAVYTLAISGFFKVDLPQLSKLLFGRFVLSYFFLEFYVSLQVRGRQMQFHLLVVRRKKPIEVLILAGVLHHTHVNDSELILV